MSGFRVAAGSIPGFTHLGLGTVLIGKNNQDAYQIHPPLEDGHVWRPDGKPLIAIVSDGLSAGADSEVGSKLAVQLYATTLDREFMRVEAGLDAALQRGATFEKDPLPHAFWARVDENALAPISSLTMALSIDDRQFRQILATNFLFTILGLLHNERFGSWFFGPLGSDGVFAANGEITVLEPQLGNKPIAPTYRYVPNEFQDRPELMRTVVHRYFPPGKLESFLVGTDGLTHYMKAEGKKLPGRSEQVRPLNAFWSDPEFLVEDTLSLYLRQCNTEWCQIVHPTKAEAEAGKRSRLQRDAPLLLDDTTLVVGRKIETGDTTS